MIESDHAGVIARRLTLFARTPTLQLASRIDGEVRIVTIERHWRSDCDGNHRVQPQLE
jgi:hypothetical protein